MDKLVKQTDVINEIEDAFSMGEAYCDKPSLIGRIKALPSISNKGKWIKTGNISYGIYNIIYHEIKCSECGYTTDFKPFKFCPNCGAEMDNR